MKNSALSKEKQAKRALTIFFSVLCVFYVMPVLLVLLNSPSRSIRLSRPIPSAGRTARASRAGAILSRA